MQTISQPLELDSKNSKTEARFLPLKQPELVGEKIIWGCEVNDGGQVCQGPWANSEGNRVGNGGRLSVFVSTDFCGS